MRSLIVVPRKVPYLGRRGVRQSGIVVSTYLRIARQKDGRPVERIDADGAAVNGFSFDELTNITLPSRVVRCH
jgi:hypothetical protein